MKSRFEHLTADNIVAHLSDMFGHSGAQQYLGEPVTVAQHCCRAPLWQTSKASLKP